MLLLEAGSFAALWAVQWIAIRRARWWDIATSQLAGNAFGRIVPGGGAAAGALQYRMLVDAGRAARRDGDRPDGDEPADLRRAARPAGADGAGDHRRRLGRPLDPAHARLRR